MFHHGVYSGQADDEEESAPAAVFEEDPAQDAAAEASPRPVNPGPGEERGSHVGRGDLYDIGGRQGQTYADPYSVEEARHEETVVVPAEARKQSEKGLKHCVPQDEVVPSVFIGVDLQVRPQGDTQKYNGDEHRLLEGAQLPFLGEYGKQETQNDGLASFAEEKEVERSA
jgi:hypothetical protein